MGPEGLREVNVLSNAGAKYLHDGLIASGKFSPVFDRPFLKEFTLSTTLDPAVLRNKLAEKGFFAAWPTPEGYVTFCVTEKRSKEEIDALLETIKELGI